MIREPAVAGLFYSEDPDELRSALRGFIGTAQSRLEAKAVIGPHAGYIYSGAVAGSVYSSIQLPRRYLLLGPNHTGRGAPFSLYPGGAWRTPLGLAVIDAELNDCLLAEFPLLKQDRAAHANEHSLEVHIPFLQAQLADFSFSAICVGSADLSSLQTLGHALARSIRSLSEPVLMIASSDMTHFESAESAARKDHLAIERIMALDPEGLYDVVTDHDISMCGYAPTVAVLTACQDLGAAVARLTQYATSGDVSGDYRRVVGYAGVVIV